MSGAREGGSGSWEERREWELGRRRRKHETSLPTQGQVGGLIENFSVVSAALSQDINHPDMLS